MNKGILKALTELTEKLNLGDVIQLQNLIGMPEEICENISSGNKLINTISEWGGHTPFLFFQALQDIRPDLIEVACKIEWLCKPSPGEDISHKGDEIEIKEFVVLLKNEISKSNWNLIYTSVTNEFNEDVDFGMVLNKLLENGFIEKDLNQLIEILISIERNDLVEKIKIFINVFSEMEDNEFKTKFKFEIDNQPKELRQWEIQLITFSEYNFTEVEQMVGDKVTVSLADVYIDLTILKGKPREINLKDETSYNEIAYLRKIANKEVEIIPVDFTQELLTYRPTEPEIWCLIGNPGCGKTFLAKRTALRFSSSELTRIQYSISIPCRNTDWHSMESSRYENEIDTKYISNWLCLGLPMASWSNILAEHLTESDGEGLLLIIDGLDEFTRKVPFGKTFLCELLTRQSLTKATIILTSRPGAWIDISAHKLMIDRYYQVLGFSPENRDLYLKKQITNESKLRACWDLMERHDEIKQLSLIPVNASLFAALLKGEDSTSISTLSKLYYELALYIIRRELSRMGLQEFSRVSLISDLHTDIQECLKGVGLIAFLGVANRDLTSEENVPLIMRQEEYPSNCLGLAHEHYKKDDVGQIKKVWTFAHLTIQEFTAAHWLSNHTWTKQCYSIRYISHSSDNFSLFKMVVRFLCGILSDKSAAILSIMYRYLTPQPIQINNMPMTLQLSIKEYKSTNFLIMGWKVFTEFYLQLTAILYETNSNSVTNRFDYYRQFLPNPIYFYFTLTVSPNEWICFLQSLQLLYQIQLIYIQTKFINPKQFIDLIEKVKFCSLHYLALEFNNTDSTSVLEYTDTIRYTQLGFDTKLCLYLERCDLANDTAVNIFSKTNQNLISLILNKNIYSYGCQLQIANQITALECIRPDVKNSEIIFSAVCQATQLRALLLDNIPYEYYQQLLTVLPNFSKLQEIELDDYSLLAALNNLSNLTYLKIASNHKQEHSKQFPYLLQLISENRNTLRNLSLYDLDTILTDMGIFLNCIALCTNLVELWLSDSYATSEDIWINTVNIMKVLIVLHLQDVRLYDTGFESLCAGLIYHPNIMKLVVTGANLTSLSCVPLIHLIPTVTQLEEMTVSGLKEPDAVTYRLLQGTAAEYSINLN